MFVLKKFNAIPVFWLEILLLAVMVAPVSGGLAIVEEGAPVTSPTGATSPVIQVTDSPIAEGGTIVIDTSSSIWWEFASYSLADTNIEVQTTAASAVWTPVIDPSSFTVTLTSSGGSTAVGENITVTFRGTATEPWLSGTGDLLFSVPVTRTDTSESVAFTFAINTPAVRQGIAIADGTVITTTDGATSPVITILDSPVPQDGSISIGVENLGIFTAGTLLTDANVEVTSSAASPVVWTRSVSPDGRTLTLTSTGGPTNTDETVTVTFTGAINTWTPNSNVIALTATREDTADTATFYVSMNIPARGGITVAEGEKITSTSGSSTIVITITNAPVARDGTILIDTTGLNAYVVGGHFRTANVKVTDSAAAATWTGSVTKNNLTLRSTGGPTDSGERVTVTFTGAGSNRWVADTGAEQTIPLNAIRGDTSETISFNIIIDIGGRPVADFSASTVSANVPAEIVFTDMSSRGPIAWNWSFGDGTYSSLQNPTHTYPTSGVYTVSLNATNTRGSGIRSKADYIDVYNAAVRQANTTISGLTITRCEGPQTLAVDTSVLPADLTPDNFVLEIHPPADRGFGNITIYAQNGIGFTKSGSIITGSPTIVHLVSEDITPASGFSDDVGANAVFTWSADLSSYPCNAIISTSIRDRITQENNAKLLRISSGNIPPAVPKGTAYTATITRTNFPSSVPVNLQMSVHPGWRASLDPTSVLFIWRIADDGNSGQILPTRYVSQDPVNSLEYYEAGSPLGMSTFGLSSFTGNNNPFQLITLAVSAYVEPQNPQEPANNDASGDQPKVSGTPAPKPTEPATRPTITPSGSLTENISAKLYTRADGVVTQTATLKSADALMTVAIGTGIAAKDREGKPLSSINVIPVLAGNLPGHLPDDAVIFAGRAYDFQPDGAVFSPAISLEFIAPPEAHFGEVFAVKTYDRATGTWQDAPTRYDPRMGTITAEITHFCVIALFAKTITPEPSISMTPAPAQTPGKTDEPVPNNAVSIFTGMIMWVMGNILIVAIVIIIIVAIFLYERKRYRF